MKNITLKVDDDTYRKARIRAAKEGTSVSAMVREFLQQRARKDDSYESRVAKLEEIYRIADERAITRASDCESLKPLTRDEIYRERLR
ncbi:MAG: ribbon-helix-helix protein, CopG family [Verrucomicrobia bacterium]|nr:ribbon-helix-helix protein, CopG family [Verrucomicrobiota bacterium]